MRLKRLTIFAIASILLGTVIVIGSISAMWWSWTRIMASGQGVTVPATVSLDVAAGEEMALWRELAGPHITVNRPIGPPPKDLAVMITDRRTGDPIETEPLDWHVRQRVMPGFERNRRTILVFHSPPHGEISISVEGSFEHDQVYRVAPSVRNWVATILPVVQVGSAVGIVLFLAGVVILIAKALKQERIAFAQDDF